MKAAYLTGHGGVDKFVYGDLPDPAAGPGEVVVAVHAANNAFPEWPAYNRMIGLGGWGDRNEKDGPYIRWREGKVVRDTTADGAAPRSRKTPVEVSAIRQVAAAIKK